MSYETILFDLDGTLTDPALGITSSVAYALDFHGVKHGGLDELKEFIGPPLKEQFMKYCGLDEKGGEAFVAKYREYYSVKGIYQNKLYPGTQQMLKNVKDAGKTVSLATSKPEYFAKIILEHFGISEYFDFVAGANMDNTRTAKAEVIRYALSNLGEGVQPEATVMVGDRLHDMLGAAECKIHRIGVTFGYGSKAELAESGAEKTADSMNELCDILLS